jgi:DNA-binding CsgD family transcriptional regulator
MTMHETGKTKLFQAPSGAHGILQRSTSLPEKNKDKWSPDSKMCVVALRDRGVIQGHLIVEFAEPVSDSEKARVYEGVEDFCVPISLYLSFQNREVGSSISGIHSTHDSRDMGSGQLTQRQILILRGMVEGKTNHELANELGFSVSTVRHETMRIYQALAVSDRKEAAKKALQLSII